MTMRKTILGSLIVLISLISCESQKEEDFRISLNYEHPRQEQYPEANFRSTKPVLPYKHHINVKDFIQKNLYDETTLDSDLKGTVEVPVDVELEVELITPIAMDKELRFAIREGGHTVGAGVVTDIVE